MAQSGAGHESTEADRVARVRRELEIRIDYDLGMMRSTKAEEDFHVLDRYAAYLGFREAEAYRRVAVFLSIIITGATLVNVLVSIKLL